MKLFELATPSATQQITKVFESYFGSKIKFEDLDRGQAHRMLSRVRSVLAEHRNTTARHQSEKNPNYLKLVMMEQALTARVKEQSVGGVGQGPATGPGAAAGAQQQQPSREQQAAAVSRVTNKFNDPQVKTAIRNAMSGRRLTPAQAQMVQGAKVMGMLGEAQRRMVQQVLRESEVQQAQVVLAAQDMVDKMQDMLEDVTEMQFKELPALVDSIKNQVGMEQAQQFNTDATAALAGLVQNLQGAKQQMETALNVVTGQAPAMDMAAPGMAGAGMPGELPPPPALDAGAEDAEISADEIVAPEVDDGSEPTKAALGRSKR